MIIRPARPTDLADLYRICLRTGAAGSDATDHYDDPALLGHVYVGPYLELAAEHARVVVDGHGPALGYCVGVADSRLFAEQCEQRWWPALRLRYPLDHPRRPSDQSLVELIHHPPAPAGDLVEQYPAHLHIDLLPALRGRGFGAALLDRVLDSLATAGAVGVHLGVDPANEAAVRFYRRVGFLELRRDPGVVLMGRGLAAAANR